MIDTGGERMKYDVWTEQINADIFRGIEAKDEYEAKKEAIKLWKSAWQPHITHIELSQKEA